MLRQRSLIYFAKRLKHRQEHWSVQQNKKVSKDRALDNFDDFYGSVYGNRWKSMRVALLCEHKYVALVNNFGDAESTISALEAEGAINIRSIYNSTKDSMLYKKLKPFANQTHKTATDTKLEYMIEAKQQDEVSSLFPEGYAFGKQEESSKTADEPVRVDFKKPLSQTIEEDSDIDYRRVVDTSLGASGLHEFIPATKLKGMEDWVPESDHYKYYSTTMDFPLKVEMLPELEFPEHLKVFTYEKGNISTFAKPKRTVTGVYSHFMMDGASILPPLVLDIKPGDRVLDACAAPGGKSLAMLQTLYPDILVSNDLVESRVNRIKRIFNDYLFDYEEKWKNKICMLTEDDARCISDYGQYDKVLVDVPCTTDRHSVMENDNNIFKPNRLKERLRIPELQAALLSNCIQLLKPGGSLVYSTCSLSPVQNDGVVHMALTRVFTEHNITATINDLSRVVRPLKYVYKFENPQNLKYGQMVVPFLPANFGPMYFCKLTRNT